MGTKFDENEGVIDHKQQLMDLLTPIFENHPQRLSVSQESFNVLVSWFQGLPKHPLTNGPRQMVAIEIESIESFLREMNDIDGMDSFLSLLKRTYFPKRLSVERILSEDPLGRQLINSSGDLAALITLNSTGEGKFRASIFDQSGFVGDKIRDDLSSVVSELVNEGFVDNGDGTIEKWSLTFDWAIGSSSRADIQKVNNNLITHKDYLRNENHRFLLRKLHDDISSVTNRPVDPNSDVIKVISDKWLCMYGITPSSSTLIQVCKSNNACPSPNEDMWDFKLHFYGLQARGFSLGAIPLEPENKPVYMPVDSVGFNVIRAFSQVGDDRYVRHGIVAYPKKLSNAEVESYELRELNPRLSSPSYKTVPADLLSDLVSCRSFVAHNSDDFTREEKALLKSAWNDPLKLAEVYNTISRNVSLEIEQEDTHRLKP